MEDSKMDLSTKACSLRKKLGEDCDSPIDIFNLVQKIENLTLVFKLLGKNISGVCYKGQNSSVIAINSEMSIGRQKFSLAHELYHLYFDDSTTKSVSFNPIGSDDEIEKKADQFASYFLIPQSSLYDMIVDIKAKENKKDLSIEDVIKIGQYYGVSHMAVLYRLLNDNFLQKEQVKQMQVPVIETARKLGYDTALYRPSGDNKKQTTFGHYIKSSEKLLEIERISNSKYDELLLDAFREDIVYGLDGEEDFSFD